MSYNGHVILLKNTVMIQFGKQQPWINKFFREFEDSSEIYFYTNINTDNFYFNFLSTNNAYHLYKFNGYNPGSFSVNAVEIGIDVSIVGSLGKQKVMREIFGGRVAENTVEIIWFVMSLV